MQVSKPIIWEYKYEDIDPNLLKEEKKGLLIFMKWWCIQKLKDTDKRFRA